MANAVKKKYNSIHVQINVNGTIQPFCVLLEDGRKYDIDKVKGKCRAASLRAGGCGIRYTIRIGAQDTYLFDEDGRRFVEMRAG